LSTAMNEPVHRTDEAFTLLSHLLADSIASDRHSRTEDFDLAERIWDRIADEAHYHGVVALVEPGLARIARTSQRPEARYALRKIMALRMRQEYAVEARELCVDLLLNAFAARGIQIALLKGAALAHLVYDRPEHRPSLDIDVLVDARNMLEAKAIAESVGFEFLEDHESKFTPRMNHLPNASRSLNGFDISLEIHVDAFSPTRRKMLTMQELTTPLQLVRRAGRIAGPALGNYDMLRHLAHHTFEPSRRIRLIHLLDLWQHGRRVSDTLLDDGRPDLEHIKAALAMAALVFADNKITGDFALIDGIGTGILPLSGIASTSGLIARLRLLLKPTEWWLRGYYGVAPTRPLTSTRLWHHPATVSGWIAQRLLARFIRITAPEKIRLKVRR
jgi:hypothetical protein